MPWTNLFNCLMKHICSWHVNLFITNTEQITDIFLNRGDQYLFYYASIEHNNRTEKQTCDRILKIYFGIVNKDREFGENFYV